MPNGSRSLRFLHCAHAGTLVTLSGEHPSGLRRSEGAMRSAERTPAVDYAHSANSDGQRQALSDHLRAVATRAAEFARPWGAATLAEAAGWLHDIGKFSSDFQLYLR